MGGMAALIPIKNDPEANERAMNNVRTDKLREVKAGHDGTWVAHPAIVPIAMEVFNEHMKGPNQVGLRPQGCSKWTSLTCSTTFEKKRSPSRIRPSITPLVTERLPNQVSEATFKRKASPLDHLTRD